MRANKAGTLSESMTGSGEGNFRFSFLASGVPYGYFCEAQRSDSGQFLAPYPKVMWNCADTENIAKRDGQQGNPKAGKTSVNSSNNKVLIVEDNDQAAHSLAQMIGHFNVQCEIASDGCKATKLPEDNKYFLIIADTHMPKISGCNLLKHIKSKYPSIPVAIISTNDTASTRGLVAKNRADFYLPKPIKMSDVEELITVATGLQDR